MNNKKRYKTIGIISVIIISILILMSMWIFFYKGNENNPLVRIEDGLEIEITNEDIKQDIDTHKYPNGEGERLIQIDFSSSNNNKLRKNLDKLYPKLPLPKELEILIYEKLKDKELASRIPKIENGYYYFIDRHNDNVEGKNDDFKDILEREKYNFTFVLCDNETETIYHYQLDT